VTEAVIATLSAHRGKDVSLAEIYKGVQGRIGATAESSIRMALQKNRPQTENPRRGFWRLTK